MQRVGAVVGVVLLAVWILTLVSCVRTPDARVRLLPRWAWLLLIVLLPAIGAILWFTIGREPAPRTLRPSRSTPPARPTYQQLTADERIRRMEEDLARLEQESQRDDPDGGPHPRRG